METARINGLAIYDISITVLTNWLIKRLFQFQWVKIIDHLMHVYVWDISLIPFPSKVGQRFNWQNDCIDSFQSIKESAHQTHHQLKGSERFPLSHHHFGPRACRPQSQHQCQGPRLPGRGRGTWPTEDLTGWGGSESAGTGTIHHLQRKGNRQTCFEFIKKHITYQKHLFHLIFS